MALIDDLKHIVSEMPAELREEDGVHSFEIVVAERKAFLTRKKLTYSVRFRVDAIERTVKFTEKLAESGFGLSSAAGDLSPGFGFKTESFNTLSGAREGTLRERSDLFGKKYEYTVDFAAVRRKFETAAQSAGYRFAYQVTSRGL